MKKGYLFKFTLFFVLFFFVFLFAHPAFAGKQGENNNTPVKTVTDSLGRKIELKNYSKIGILNPAVIKTLHMLNYDFNNVVGVDSYSISIYKNYLKNDTKIIGDYNGPDLEKIISNGIDLLIIDKSFPVQKLAEIEKNNINYFVYSPDTIESLKNDLKNLSLLFSLYNNFKTLKKQYIDQYENKIKNLKLHITGISIIWYDKNFMLSGSDSFIANFFELAGIKYSIEDKGWPKISLEKFIELDPDFILVASTYIKKDLFNDNIFTHLKAKKTGNIIFITPEIENMILQPSFDTFKGFFEIFSKIKVMQKN